MTMQFAKPITILAIGTIAMMACKPKQPSEEVLEFVKEFDGKTLAEARQMLQSESEKVDGFIGFMKTFKAEKPESFKPEDEKLTDPYVQKGAAELEAKYVALLAGDLGFKQEVQYPGSVVGIDGDFRRTSDFSDISTPDFTTAKIFFHDGTTLEKPYAMDANTALPSVKTIDSIQADVAYSYPTKVTMLTLDKSHHKVTFKGAEIKIDKMTDNWVRLLMGGVAFHDYIQIEALNKDGKPLDYSSRNSGIDSPGDLNQLMADFSKALKSMIAKLDKGGFKDVAALQAEIKKQFPNGTPFDEAGHDGYVEGFFKGNVAKVNVYLTDDRKKVAQKMTIKNLDPNYSGLFMTGDEKTQAYGFKDATGQFVIPPTYKKLNQLNPYFFANEDYNGYYYYRLDTATRKLVKLDYEARELTSQLATVTKPGVTNGTGVMDGNGNLIIPANFDAIFLDPHEAVLFANRSEEDAPLQGANSLYDYSGHLLSPDVYYTSGGTFHDGFLLVIDKARKIYFVDNKGKKAIDLKGYVDAEPFSEGLAVVRNENHQFGFINTKGAVAIPCSYTSASSFNEGIAMVSRTKNDQSEIGLINTKNEAVVPFKQVSSSGQSGEGAKKEYTLDDKKYNAKGVEIKK